LPGPFFQLFLSWQILTLRSVWTILEKQRIENGVDFMSRKIISMLVLFLLLLPSGICLADSTGADQETLTVEQAINLALSNRNDVKNAALSLEAANISNDLANDDLESYLIPGTNQYAGGIISADQLYTSEYNLQTAQKNYDTKIESVKFSVYSKYYDVVSALDNRDAKELASKQAEEKLKISELRCQLGMDTRLTLYQAQQQAITAQGNHSLAQQTLDQKYIALMEYIGKPSSERPALVRELIYTPLKIDNPEARFSEIVKDSPAVWLAKKSLELTKQTTGDSNSEELDDVNLEKAEVNILTTRDSQLQATRTIYYNILSLEESYNNAVESAKVTDEALRVAKLLYEAGMGTKLDVTATEITANSAHQALDSLSYQHALLMMAFEKPWAYSTY
jgi:outer membrane protein TolC